MIGQGLKKVLLAAGLVVAGMAAPVALAQTNTMTMATPTTAVPANTTAPANASAPAAAPAATGAAPAGAAAASAAGTANPNSPLLAQDGAPAMAVDPTYGHPVPGAWTLQPQVTDNGRYASWFHNIILFPLITAISVFVLLLLVVVVAKYRQRAHREPSRTSHNTVLEVLWTGLPVLILAMIAAPSFGLLARQFTPAPANAITLKAIGNQWFWSYEYPDLGVSFVSNMLRDRDQAGPTDRLRTDADGPPLLATDNRVVLPVGVPIRLITTSQDVIHSWAMPAFWIKLDAVPGRLNETSFTIERPGLYFGQCSELCGQRHAYMPITVEAVPLATFNAWVQARGGHLVAPAAAAQPHVTGGLPQPGADTTENGSAAANSAGPAENVTTTAITSNQGATGNPSGAGNAGQ